MEAQESTCQISQHDVLHMNFSEFTYVFFFNFSIYFLRLPWELVFGVFKDN